MRNKTVDLIETDIFKDWLKEKCYQWPEDPIEQRNMLAEFKREGLERAKIGRMKQVALSIVDGLEFLENNTPTYEKISFSYKRAQTELILNHLRTFADEIRKE